MTCKTFLIISKHCAKGSRKKIEVLIEFEEPTRKCVGSGRRKILFDLPFFLSRDTESWRVLKVGIVVPGNNTS